jgi:hypothetical protein
MDIFCGSDRALDHKGLSGIAVIEILETRTWDLRDVLQVWVSKTWKADHTGNGSSPVDIDITEVMRDVAGMG